MWKEFKIIFKNKYLKKFENLAKHVIIFYYKLFNFLFKNFFEFFF